MPNLSPHAGAQFTVVSEKNIWIFLVSFSSFSLLLHKPRSAKPRKADAITLTQYTADVQKQHIAPY